MASALPLVQWYAKAQSNGLKAGLLRTALIGPNPAAGFDRAIAAERARVKAVGEMSSAVSSFKAAVQGLKSPSAVAPAQATSTNAAVAAASTQPSAAAATYIVSVSQLARSQVANSTDFADPNMTLVGSGTLTVQLGNYDGGTNTFTAGPSASVSINVTNGSLNTIASAINAAGAGISANVVQDPNGYHMVLTSTTTGAASAFKITTTDLDGGNTDMAGLSRLAYDPTGVAGAGKNLTLAQAAQNANLTVNGAAQTSAGNAGISIASGVSLNLAQTGATTVTITPNKTAVENAATALVKAYNTLVGKTKSLSGPAGSLGGGAATELLRSMSDTAQQRFTGVGSMTSLARIGITPKADGTLSLDDSAIQAAMTINLPGTVAVLNDAAQAFEKMADRYAAPGGEFSLESQVAAKQLSYLEMINGIAQSADSLSQALASQSYQSALRLAASSQFLSLWNSFGNA